MKLFYARKDDRILCLKCRSTLKRGEIYVRTGYKKDNKWGFLFYHPDCYLKMVEEKLARRFVKFKEERNPPKKLGRPRKYINPTKAQRLICLLLYHRKAGNTDRVAELGIKLKELEL